jgi:hypothetical protein
MLPTPLRAQRQADGLPGWAYLPRRPPGEEWPKCQNCARRRGGAVFSVEATLGGKRRTQLCSLDWGKCIMESFDSNRKSRYFPRFFWVSRHLHVFATQMSKQLRKLKNREDGSCRGRGVCSRPPLSDKWKCVGISLPGAQVGQRQSGVYLAPSWMATTCYCGTRVTSDAGGISGVRIAKRSLWPPQFSEFWDACFSAGTLRSTTRITPEQRKPRSTRKLPASNQATGFLNLP